MRCCRPGLGGLLLLGCAAAPKPALAPKPATVAAQPAEERRPYAELAVTPKSVELDGAWLHVTSLRHTLEELPSLVKELPGLTLFKDLVEGRGGLVPPDVAAVIDPAQPIDLFFPMANDAEVPLLSFRVRSAEAIEQGAAGLTLARLEPGVWRIGSVSGEPVEPPPEAEAEAEPDDDEPAPEDSLETSGMAMGCRLVHLPPPVGFRVLCSRGTPPGPAGQAFLLAPQRDVAFTSDAHLELAGSGYAAALEHLQKITSAKVGSTSQNPGSRAGEELVSDTFAALLGHERLRLDVSLKGLLAEAQLDLDYARGTPSSSFSSWLEQSSKAELPSGFARLPADNQLTLGMSLGSAVVQEILRAIDHDIDEETITSEAQKRELLESIHGILPQDGRLTFALGVDVPAAMQALESPAVRLADDADKPLAPAAVRELQAALGGWFVIGVEEPPARYLTAVKRAYKVGKQTSKTRPGHEPKNRRSSSELTRLSGAPAGLPRDSLHIVSQERPDKKYEPPTDGSSPPMLPYDEHILVVPDGARVWVVVARSEAVALKQAQALLAQSASMKSQVADPGVMSAAMQVAFVVLSDVDYDSKIQRAAARKLLSQLNSAPQQARLAVPLDLRVLPREDSAGFRLHFSSSVQLDQLLGQAIALMPGLD